jgi:hypothetical protein
VFRHVVFYITRKGLIGGRRGRDRMVVGFTTTCAISAYHSLRCEIERRSWRGVLDTTLCDKVSDLRIQLPYDQDYDNPMNYHIISNKTTP